MLPIPMTAHRVNPRGRPPEPRTAQQESNEEDCQVTYPALLPADRLSALRDALIAADYSSVGIAKRLGPSATDAIKRNDFRAALRATKAKPGDNDPLATLIRLFVCGQTEDERDVRRALNKDDAIRAGLIQAAGDQSFKAGLDLEPYGERWWVVSDPPSERQAGQLPKDHVLGVGAASETLANAIVRDPVGRALDLGTGCGVQSLHLSTHADSVVATDLSERALRFAATTAALSGQRWDLRKGDMARPVEGEKFDLIVSNPPFVAGPGVTTHTYRDSGRPGDAICRELAESAATLLNDGGAIQFLANWLHIEGEDWTERVASWFAGAGMDLWVVEREISDPLSYVDLWLTDASEDDDPQRAAAWLDWFDANRVEAIGFGLISARHNHNQDPAVRLEPLRQPVAHPFGPQVKAWFERQDWLRRQSFDDLLAGSYRAAAKLTLQQDADLTSDGWDVTTQRLIQDDGLMWTEEIDPVTLALVGGANGEIALRDQLSLLEAAYEAPPGTLAPAAAVIVRHLVERGFLTPAADA
jgi:methylase of polypeptide subunit release factors